MTVLTPRDTEETMLIPLSELISLKETTFHLPEHATRGLDHAHVKELAAVNHDSLPPIKVAITDEGYAVVDGYHRWEARKRNVALQVLGLTEETEAKQDKALAADQTPEVMQKITTLLEETPIKATIGAYADERAVAKAALTANLQHGKAPEHKARVYIALELYDLTRGEVPEPSQAEIARIVGISRATLNEKIMKRTADEKKAAATASKEGEETPAGTEATEEEIPGAKVLKAADRLLKQLDGLYEESPAAYLQVIEKLLQESIRGMNDSYITTDDTTYAEGIRKALAISPDTVTSELGYLTRFHTAMGIYLKKASRPKKAAVAPKAPATKAPAESTD